MMTRHGSSKEKYHRLNPYYEIIIKQLQIRFDDYVIPDDFTHKLADGFSITNRGDIHSNALLLTITKLRPLIAKKLDISWAELRKILNTIIKRIKDQQYDFIHSIPSQMTNGSTQIRKAYHNPTIWTLPLLSSA